VIGSSIISDFLGSERLAVGLIILGLFALLVILVGFNSAKTVFLSSLAAMVPIALAAMGEIINERGGLFNIGIEGIMLVATFSSVFFTELAGSWLIGLLAGMITGAFIALIFGLMSTYGTGNQLVAGVGINLFAAGFVAYYMLIAWNNPGFHMVNPNTLRVPKLRIYHANVTYFVIVALVVTFAAWFVIHYTKFGLHLRAAGRDPFVTDVSGIDVYRLRTVAATIGGALAGLAGAYISLDWLGMTTTDLIQGRGFIAIACVVFSGLDPILALEVAYFFGLIRGISIWLQSVPWASEFMSQGGSYFFLTLPYLSVIGILIAFPQREKISGEIGKSYKRE